MQRFLLPSEAYGYMHNNKALYRSRKVAPPFKPSSIGENKFDYIQTTEKENKNNKSQSFNSGSSKDSNRLKFNKMFKKQEVGLYLKLSKLKESMQRK